MAAHTSDVVACVVTDGTDVCLVRRSQQVSHDRGRWHCVTGYLDPGSEPRACVLDELGEELGLTADRLESIIAGPVLEYEQSGMLWRVHTFLAHTDTAPFRLNWENDEYVWAAPDHPTVGCVSWLPDVYASVLPARPTIPRH